MTQTSGTPPVSPETPATLPAAPATPPAGTPPAIPPVPEGVKIEGDKVVLDLAKYRNLERDAARARSRKTPSADDRRNDRYSQPPAGDDDDPQLAEMRTKVSQTERENMQLKLNNKVRDLLESDEYKALPDTAKRILRKNPMAVVDNRAKSFDDAVADIQDWLDEEISLAKPATPPVTPTPETPPVPGAGPTPPRSDPAESTEGKTGPERSMTILKNLMKQKGAK